MAFDPELNLLYVGVGNGTPWNRDIRSPGGGDNLFLASIVALNPDNGTLVWHYQTTPGETWDYTATQHMILADIEIDGTLRKVIMQAPKNGFFYVLDRTDGPLHLRRELRAGQLGHPRRPRDRTARGDSRSPARQRHRAGLPLRPRRPQLAPDGVQPRHRLRLHPRHRDGVPLRPASRTSSTCRGRSTPAST